MATKSRKPRDLAGHLVNRRIAAPVERATLSLGQWTAGATVTPAPRFLADRRLVVREVWFVASAVPSDADGALTINALVWDDSEAADDTIVSAFDAEAQLTVANKAVEAVLVTETDELELTLEKGDSLRFQLVNDSAGIDVNADVSAVVIYQVLENVEVR